MKKILNLALLAALLGAVGCVNTVTKNEQGMKPSYKDRLDANYAKPIDQVFEASKRAVTSFGNVTKEGSVMTGTNQVRVVEGSINERLIYIRLEQVKPKQTAAVVQVRTKLGGTDLKTAKEVVDRIAVELE